MRYIFYVITPQIRQGKGRRRQRHQKLLSKATEKKNQKLCDSDPLQSSERQQFPNNIPLFFLERTREKLPRLRIPQMTQFFQATWYESIGEITSRRKRERIHTTLFFSFFLFFSSTFSTPIISLKAFHISPLRSQRTGTGRHNLPAEYKRLCVSPAAPALGQHAHQHENHYKIAAHTKTPLIKDGKMVLPCHLVE